MQTFKSHSQVVTEHALQLAPAHTLMRLAPSAKRSVFHVSSLWLDAGVTLQMIATLAPVPVSEGCKGQLHCHVDHVRAGQADCNAVGSGHSCWHGWCKAVPSTLVYAIYSSTLVYATYSKW